MPIVPYVNALKSKDNEVVNLAGLALGQLNDPAAISPLIDALVTTHKYIIPPARAAAAIRSPPASALPAREGAAG